MTTLTPLTPDVRAVVRLCSTALLLDTVFFSVALGLASIS